ncbi:patatin-like phospholipase family protein [Caminicella sporogenes]|uniref:patatin-like phospholipase family protein n=1 Tax=Caminicella sporogenes TaxID=166485 RepID=UPI002541719E|nr:patatin-like phospholipase family protein [Caminicella sporogenes]WIF94878.1 patatin-like phospholipase family protein [Caminicella sporogenes]
MRGLFLQGGGAKGAFQAGVVFGLFEKGLDFQILSGTSIGAINSYFIYTNNIDKMREMWVNIDNIDFENDWKDDKVIDNSSLIKILEDLEGRNDKIEAYFVNYVKITGNNLKEKIVDITKFDKKEGLKFIKYSSLLPGKLDRNKTLDKIIEEFNSEKLFDEFKKDLEKGVYDGYNLDGGIVNNNFLSPFTENKVDKLYIVTFSVDYQIPDYILNKYSREDIIVIKPEVEFMRGDTIRFKKEFCEKIFYEGYKISKKI